MKKRKNTLFVATAFAMMTLTAVAQERKISEALKVVKLTSNDVNLRQAPSAKSARLIRDCGGGEGPCTIQWTTATLKAMNSWGIGQEALRTQYLAVSDTVKGDDGENWLHCFYATNLIEYVRWDVYVKEKYTRPAVIRSLFANGKMLPGAIEHSHFDDAVLKVSGTYKDWFIGASWDDMESIGYLYIGRYQNGLLTISYEVPFSNEKSQNTGSEPLYVKSGTLYFDKNLYCADCYQTGTLDLHKLCARDNFLSNLMKACAVKDFETSRVLCAVEGRDEWCMF